MENEILKLVKGIVLLESEKWNVIKDRINLKGFVSEKGRSMGDGWLDNRIMSC